MLKLRIRLMEDNGTKSSKSRVIKTESITVTHVLNEAPRLTFQASRADVGAVNTPFVVGVEYSTGGSFQPLPEHNLFIVEQDSDDSLDPAKVVTYECQGFVAWLLSGALHNWHRTAKDGKRTWVEPGKNTASAGWVLNGMYTESKNGGWFPALNKDFNGTTDSAGKSWTNSDRVEQAWELDKNIMQILEQMTLDGLCDWTSSGTTWRLFRPDTYGTDKAELVLGGTGFESVPVKVDASSLYSHIRAIPEGLPWQNFTSDTTIRDRFGHRSVVLQQSGVKSATTSARLAQPHIEAGKQVLREESYNWTPRIEPNGSRGICPWADFKLGDHVTARSRGGKLVRRVVGIIAEQNSGMTKVQVRVGEKIGSAGSRLARRLESVAVGGIVGGSGSAFPSTPPPVRTTPDRVDGLVLVNNQGEWLADGSAKSIVEISWAPVTDNVDGTEAAIESYEVWVRRPDTQLRYLTTTTETSIVLETLVPGEPILIAVRAMSDSRRYGEFSLELSVTPALPKSLVPTKVTGLTITGNVAEFSSAGPVATISFTWNPITKSIDGEDITIEEYEVYDGRSLLERVTTTSSSIVVPSGREVSITIRGHHEIGGWSDPSDPVVVTAATPDAVIAQPTAPILVTGMGNVVARWDGNYVQTPTNAVMNIRAEARVGTSGAWVRQGTYLDDAGTFNIRLGVPGDTVQVRFISFDKLLRDTGTSEISSITVQGVAYDDLDTVVKDRIDTVEQIAEDALAGQVHIERTVNGLNRKFTSIESPGRGFLGYENLAPEIKGSGEWAEVARFTTGTEPPEMDRPEDFRIRDLGTGETVMEIEQVAGLTGLNAIAGVATREGKPAVRIIPTGTGLSAAFAIIPVTEDTVTGVGTVSLDAPLQGTLDDLALSLIVGESAVAAPNLAGDHLLRAEGAETDEGYATLILVNGAEQGNGDVWWSGIGLYEGDGPDDDAIPFNQGDEWHQLGWADPADEGIADRLTIIHTWVWNGQDWVHYDYWGENFFATDSVTSRIVRMDEGFADKFWANEANFGRIGVDFLEPNIGDTIDIHGNIVITGLLDPDEGRIPAIEDSVDQVASDAAQAIADAATADGKALAAQTLASDLQESFGQHRQVFRVTNGVPEVGSLDGDNVLRIESDRITMIQGGDVVTYWDQGQLVVGTTVASHMQLRNPQSGAGHIIEHDGSGGTTVKSI